MDLWRFSKEIFFMLTLFFSVKKAAVEAASINRESGYRRQPRILGGSLIKKGETIPYQVSFSYVKTGIVFCSGVILDPYIILTTAYCLTNETTTSVQVTAGTKYRNFKKDGVYEPQRRNVSSFIIHEHFNEADTYANDIAMVVLKTPLAFTPKKVEKATLPQQDESFSGNLTVTGWGKDQNGAIPQVLKKATFPIVRDIFCTALQKNSDTKKRKICAGNGAHNTCQGDSGSPAVCNRESSSIGSLPILCGMVSIVSCINPGEYPGYFTNVAYYMDWINKSIQRIYSGIKCRRDQFYCLSSKQCIQNSYVCDGHLDCIGGEDESECLNYNSCGSTGFVCNNGTCVENKEWICDNDPDCRTYEDEYKCGVSKSEDCSGLYRCKNENRCIPEDWRCDWNEDCDDGSDESGCYGYGDENPSYGLDSSSVVESQADSTTDYEEPEDADSELRPETQNTTTTATSPTNAEAINEIETVSANATATARPDTSTETENETRTVSENTTTASASKPAGTMQGIQAFLKLLNFG